MIRLINKKEKVKVRFAPSPTGFLHIGGVRTALFNFLFARHNKGKLLLRIEDTDTERSKKEYEKSIIETMDWLGLDYDEFYRQSERSDIYQKHLKKIIDAGHAYVSKEEPKEVGDRTEVIRFKNPNIKIKFTDLIRGEVEFDTTDLGDFVIAKSMTEPLYHFAVVVDDFESGVTHVIRGEEHLSNTPRQILIQRAIGAHQPLYAHIPLILAPDRSKLSKRHGAVSVTEFRDRGYIKEALINFLALLGWNPGTEQEIFSLKELVKVFDIAKIQKGGAIFNETKLQWFNHEYIKVTPTKEIAKKIVGIFDIDAKLAEKLAPVVIERINVWGDLSKMQSDGELQYFFTAPSFDPKKMIWKDSTAETTKSHIEYSIAALEKISEKKWVADNIKNVVWDYATEKGRGAVLWPIRFALTGKEKSPDPFTVASIIGKTETLTRLKFALSKL